jgi:hypothetical protein
MVETRKLAAIPVSPKGNHHEVVKVALLRRWYPILPAALVNLENIRSWGDAIERAENHAKRTDREQGCPRGAIGAGRPGGVTKSYLI